MGPDADALRPLPRRRPRHVGRRHGFPPAARGRGGAGGGGGRTGSSATTATTAATRQAICGWMSRRHGWDVEPAAVATTHGVVAGFAICLQAFTEPGDGVILFTPVYHAFHRIIRANGREILQSPLVLRQDGRYAMDLAALAGAAHGARADGGLLLAAQSGRPGLERRRDPRAGRLLPHARPAARRRRDPPRPRAARRPPRAGAARRPRDPRPAADADRRHQDLQHRRHAHRQRHHPRRGAAPPLRRRTSRLGHLAQPLRRPDDHRRLQARRRLGRRPLPLPHRQRRPLRRGHRRDARPPASCRSTPPTSPGWISPAPA